MKMFISKRRILILILCISLSVLLMFQFNAKLKISKPDSPSLITSDENFAYKIPTEPLVYKCCTRFKNDSIRTNVYFLKTHKTGGTTVQSVILRFAFLNSLDVMNVIYESYYWPLTNFSIYPETWTPNGKYHILANHMRYTSNLKSYQYPGTSMVTLLRNPTTLFQSIFIYYRMDRMIGMNFRQFLNASKQPEFLFAADSMYRYRGYNQMSNDLGFDSQRTKNRTVIDEFIAKIDREFDLVMIVEHMEESLILLANLMGWPLEYVTYLKLNARISEPDTYSLTLRDEITISELNQVDTLLYHHFLRKFRKCVQQYGEQKMKDQVQRLKLLNERFKKRCVAGEIVRFNAGDVGLIEYKAKDESDLECLYSIKNPPYLPMMARKIQAEKNFN